MTESCATALLNTTAFRTTATQMQRPGNYSLLQINECRKQCTVIVRTALHPGDIGFESTLYYQLWFSSFPPLSAHILFYYLPLSSYLSFTASLWVSIPCFYMCVYLRARARVYIHAYSYINI